MFYYLQGTLSIIHHKTASFSDLQNIEDLACYVCDQVLFRESRCLEHLLYHSCHVFSIHLLVNLYGGYGVEKWKGNTELFMSLAFLCQWWGRGFVAGTDLGWSDGCPLSNKDIGSPYHFEALTPPHEASHPQRPDGQEGEPCPEESPWNTSPTMIQRMWNHLLPLVRPRVVQ